MPGSLLDRPVLLMAQMLDEIATSRALCMMLDHSLLFVGVIVGTGRFVLCLDSREKKTPRKSLQVFCFTVWSRGAEGPPQ